MVFLKLYNILNFPQDPSCRSGERGRFQEELRGRPWPEVHLRVGQTERLQPEGLRSC